MAKDRALNPVTLRATLLQGAANGFIQASLNTGISLGSLDGLRLLQVQVEWPDLIYAGAGNVTREVAATRATKAAVPLISDDDVIFKDKNIFQAIGTSGIASWSDALAEIEPKSDIILIEDIIYVQFKTSNCTLAGTCYVNLIFQPVTVTDSEKVGILQSRIN